MVLVSTFLGSNSALSFSRAVELRQIIYWCLGFLTFEMGRIIIATPHCAVASIKLVTACSSCNTRSHRVNIQKCSCRCGHQNHHSHLVIAFRGSLLGKWNGENPECSVRSPKIFKVTMISDICNSGRFPTVPIRGQETLEFSLGN